MPQYIVTAKKLNKRKIIPAQLPMETGTIGFVYKGYTFEGIEVPASEIPNSASGKWYKDRDQNYYWGGGVTETSPSSPGIIFQPQNLFNELNNLVNWNKSISQIPVEWRESKGKNVKIAVLDTGIFEQHRDLTAAVSDYEDYTKVKDKIDYDGHGTHVSGLIAARSSFNNGVIGVSPLVELIILKVLPDANDDTGGSEDYQNIIDGMDTAVNKGADIINLSLSLQAGKDDMENERLKINGLIKKIQEITDRKIIIIAAAGDNANLKDKKLFFPALCDGVISVASINEGYFVRNPDFSEKLNIIGPNVNYTSTFKAPVYYERFGGCSMTTAFITGIVALAISANRINGERFSKPEILSMLDKYSLKLDMINYNDSNNFYYHILNGNP